MPQYRGTTEASAIRPEAVRNDILMQPGQVLTIDMDAEPYRDANATLDRYGIAVPNVAKVKAGRTQRLDVLDTREYRGTEFPVIVVAPGFGKEGGKRNYIGVRNDGPAQRLGRGYHSGLIDYDLGVSADHFGVALRGNRTLYISNRDPLNGTWLSGNVVKLDRGSAAAREQQREQARQAQDRDGLTDSYTRSLRQELPVDPYYQAPDEESPNGYYNGYKIIGRNSASVKNSVYFTLSSEILLVDTDSLTLKAAQQDMLLATMQYFEGRQPTTQELLTFVKNYTGQLMRPDEDRVKELCEPLYDRLGMIPLSTFFNERVGACRHTTVANAFFIETLIDAGWLKGTVAVERNADLVLHGGHAWAIFKFLDVRDDIVVDTTQDFVGTKEEARARGLWRYYLSTDD